MKTLLTAGAGFSLAVVQASVWSGGVPAWVERLGWTLVHSTWQLAAVATIAALAEWSLKRRSANVRYIVAVAVLGLMFALPCATWMMVVVPPRPIELATAAAPAPIRDGNDLVDDADSLSPLFEPNLASVPFEQHLSDATLLAGATHDEAIRREQGNISPSTPSLDMTSPTGWQRLIERCRAVIEPQLSLVVALWFVGAMLCALRPIWGLWAQWRLRRIGLTPVPEVVRQTLLDLARRMGLARIVRIAESARVRVPMVVGYLRPMILLPASVLTGLTPTQLESLLAHELAHIRRHDWLVNAIQVLLEALLFYHPAVWWLSSRIRHERELCCDDVALAVIGDRATYGRMLLALEELRHASPSSSLVASSAVAATGGSLVQRVRRLLPLDRNAERSPRGWLAGAIALSVMIAIMAGAFATTRSNAGSTPLAANEQGATASDAADPAAGADTGPEASTEDPQKGQDAVPADGLEFLAGYPKLSGLSLDMTESQFRVFAAKRKLTLQTTPHDGGQSSYSIPTGDDHTVIVMFDNGKCGGIQRLRGEDRVEKVTFASVSVSFKAPLARKQPEQITIKTDGSCVYHIDERSERGTATKWPEARLMSQLSNQRMLELERLLLQTDWLKAEGGEGPARHTDAEEVTIAVVRDGQTKTITCLGTRPEPYHSLLWFLRGIAEQEHLVYLIDSLPGSETARKLALIQIRFEIEAWEGRPGRSLPYLDYDYGRLLPTFTRMIRDPSTVEDEVLTAIKLVTFVRADSEFEFVARLKHDRESNVRNVVAAAIADFGGKRAVPVLVEMASSTEEARWGLVRLGEIAVPSLVKLIEPGIVKQDFTSEMLVRAYLDHRKELSGSIDNRVVTAVRQALAKTSERNERVVYFKEFLKLVDERAAWSVKGRAVDADGKPMAGVMVSAATGMGTLVGGGKGETDADGRYEFTFGQGVRIDNDDVELQVATISAHKTGFFEKNLSRQGDLLMARKLPDELDWGKRTKDDIILPGRPRQLDFVMLPAARLSGTLIDENEKPLAGYGVSLRGDELPPSSGVVGSTKTDEKGRFSIGDIPTGFKFQILVEPAKREPPWNAWASGPFDFRISKGDEFFIQEATREVAANRFELQVKGSGVNWKEALKTGRSHQKLEPTGDYLTSESRLHAATIRLELSPPGEPQAAAPLPDKLRVVVRDATNAKARFEGEVKLAAQDMSLVVPETFKLPFAKVRAAHVRVENARPTRIDVLFDFLGEAKEERRILVDLKGLDADGQTVHHTWRLGSDVRTEKEPDRAGTRELVRATYSSVRMEIPRHLVPKLHTLEIALREMSSDDLKHFPEKPSKTDMTITRPDAEGRFTVSFDNPIDEYKPGRWPLDPEKNQVIFQVFVKNAEGKLLEKIFKQLAAHPAGGYRVDVQVKPEWFEHSAVSVTFVTIQPNHDEWVKAFFHDGKGTGYTGLWSGDGGPLTKTMLNGQHVGWLAMNEEKATIKNDDANVEAPATAQDVFTRIVSLEAKEMPLREALTSLARAVRVPLRLDEPALAQAGLDLNAPLTLTITDEPLNDALLKLIDWNAYQGVYRELRGGALFLTTIEASRARMERVLPEWLKPAYNQQKLSAITDDDDQITSVTVSDALTDDLLARFKSLPKLRELQIGSDAKLTAVGFGHLAELTELQKLSLSSFSDVDRRLADVAVKHIVGLKSLRELRLHETGITDAGLRHLEGMPQLAHLDVYQEGRLTDAAIASIAKLKRLRFLSLTSYVGTERLGWMRFSPEALRQLSVLQDLEVLALPGQTAPADLFLALPRLTSVDLRGELIDDAVAERIAQRRGLRTLSLSVTRITDEGWKRIASLPELRRLTLRGEKITDVGIGHLKSLQKLNHLELRTGSLTDVSLDHLAEIKSLTRLDLWGGGSTFGGGGSNFTVTGLQQLKRLPNLRTLWLINLEDPGGYAGLKVLTQLRELVFEMAGIGQQEFNDLEAALPLTRISAGTGGGHLRSIREPKPAGQDVLDSGLRPTNGLFKTDKTAQDATSNRVKRVTDLDPEEWKRAESSFGLLKDRELLKPIEMSLYWRLLGWAEAQTFTELHRRIERDSAVTDWLDQPDKSRGRPVRLRLHIRRILEYEPPENVLGIKKLYEAWGFTDESKSAPCVVCFTKLPEGMKTGAEVIEEGVFVGYFLKLTRYKDRAAPLLLGRLQKPNANPVNKDGEKKVQDKADDAKANPPAEALQMMVAGLAEQLPMHWRHPRIEGERTVVMIPGMYLADEQRPHVLLVFTNGKSRPKTRWEREDERYEYLGETPHGHAHLFISMRIAGEPKLAAAMKLFDWPEAAEFCKAFVKEDHAKVEILRNNADDRYYADYGWGPNREGLRARWVVHTREPVVGGRLSVGVEVANFGAQTRTIDLRQGHPWRSWQLLGPDGKPVAFRASQPITSDDTYTLKPQHSFTLFSGTDMAELFDVSQPGRYTLTFTGRSVRELNNLPKIDVPADRSIPAAKDLAVTIASAAEPDRPGNAQPNPKPAAGDTASEDRALQERVDAYNKAFRAQAEIASAKYPATAKPEQPELMVGEPAWILFEVRNQTDADKRAIVGGDYRNALGRPDSFKVDVFDAGGKRVTQPSSGFDRGGMSYPVSLPAKKSAEFKLFLPHWATIAKPGQYRMTIWRELDVVPGEKDAPGQSAFDIKPNKITVAAETTFTVVPADEAKFGALIERLGPQLVSENSDDSERADKMLQAVRVPLEWSHRAASKLDVQSLGLAPREDLEFAGDALPVPDERAVPWYLKYLAQSRGARKQTALRFLGDCRSETAFHAIMESFNTTAGDITDTTTRDLAESSASAVHHAAIHALATFATSHPTHPHATKKLFSLGDHPHMPVRLTVLHFAATNKSPQARAIIDKMTKDKDPTLAAEARRCQKLLADEDAKRNGQANLPGPATSKTSTATPLTGQDDGTTKLVGELAGRVIDADGKPVANADVMLYRKLDPIKYDRSELVVRGQTVVDGTFRLKVDPAILSQSAVWAASAGKGVGVRPARLRQAPPNAEGLPDESVPADSPDRFLIRLNATPARVAVTDSQAKPVAGAKVVVTLVRAYRTPYDKRKLAERQATQTGSSIEGTLATWMDSSFFEVPPLELKQHFEGATNGEGVALLPGLPSDRIRLAVVETENFGRQALTLDSLYEGQPDKFEIRLRPVGRIEGEVVVDARAAAAGFRAEGLKLSLRTGVPEHLRLLRLERESSEARLEFQNVPDIDGQADAVVDATGRFVVPAIAVGALSVTDSLPVDSPITIVLRTNVRVDANKITPVTFDAAKGVLARGLVRKRDSGAPVANSSVAIRPLGRTGSEASRQHFVQTGADGSFRLHLLPGAIEFWLNSAIPGYASVNALEQPDVPYALGIRHVILERAESVDLPPIELVPTEKRTGTLLNKQGRPTAASWMVQGYPKDNRVPCGSAETNDRGEFVLEFPESFPPVTFTARQGENQLRAQTADLRTHELKVVQTEPLVLQFQGKFRDVRYVATANPKQLPQMKPDELKATRAARQQANDRDAAKKLVGDWLLTLPLGYAYEITIAPRNDGCLKLDCEKGIVSRGTYAFNGQRLEVVDLIDGDVDDFVWEMTDDGTLVLISEQVRNGGDYLGAKLTRIPAVAKNDAEAPIQPQPARGATKPVDSAGNDEAPKASPFVGSITQVDRPAAMVTIDLGERSGLKPGTKFDVYPKGTHSEGFKPDGGLGQIEVTRILDALRAEARIILSDEAMGVGDRLYSATWKPNAEPKRGHAGDGAVLSLKGRVAIDGQIPKVPPLKVQPGLMLVIPRNDEDERGNESRKAATPVVEIPDDSLVISKDGGIANVAIYLKKAPSAWKPTTPPREPVELRSADNRFHPRMSFVRVGQPIRLFGPQNEADNFVSAPNNSNALNMLVNAKSKRDLENPFLKSEKFPIPVASNLHPWQKAWLLIFDHPFAAITDADGQFEIRDLPAGEHHFTVWHERRGYLDKDLSVRIATGQTTEVSLKYSAAQFQKDGP